MPSSTENEHYLAFFTLFLFIVLLFFTSGSEVQNFGKTLFSTDYHDPETKACPNDIETRLKFYKYMGDTHSHLCHIFNPLFIIISPNASKTVEFRHGHDLKCSFHVMSMITKKDFFTWTRVMREIMSKRKDEMESNNVNIHMTESIKNSEKLLRFIEENCNK